jgi:hypothetical protein
VRKNITPNLLTLSFFFFIISNWYVRQSKDTNVNKKFSTLKIITKGGNSDEGESQIKSE